jgi:hypothetical protein
MFKRVFLVFLFFFIFLSFSASKESIYYEDSKIFWMYSLENLDHLRRTENIEHLIILWLGGSPFNLKFLEEIPQLTQLLHLSIGTVYNIENMESLKVLNNLESLSITDSSIIDISPIANLKTLKNLDLCGLRRVNDISAISGLENLVSLTIDRCNNIENINPIFDIISLEQLQLDLGEERDLTNIERLAELEFLNTHINNQSNINRVSNLNGLKRLWIKFEAIDDVSPLLNLINLEEIVFFGEDVDVIPLAEISSLQQIVVMFSTREKYQYFLDNGGDIFERNGIRFFRNVPH